MASRYYKKYIRIPPSESIDIRTIGPIINHPLFQRLLYISQLGTTLAVFPGASHNRMEHALGVYAKAVRFTNRMVRDGFLTEKEARNVCLFGLMHDIGHGPFSHVIEPLTPVNGDEDQNGLVVLEAFKKELKACGGDYALMKKIFKHESPLYRIIMDKNVGMDKLDYLERDVYHTGFGQRPDIESIFNYLVYLKGKLVVDKKSLEAAKQMQKLYIYMYKEVHLHKSSLIASRFLQKMVRLWLDIDKGDPATLWQMTDYELVGRISAHSDKRLQFLHQCYKTRTLPRTGLVIRLKNREFNERLAGKSIRVISEDMAFFQKMERHSSLEAISAIEAKVARVLDVPEHTIVIVPTLTPWRFVPQDILYHDDGRLRSLKDTHKEYFDALKSEMSDYMAVRVCIIGDRNVIYKNATKVYKAISSAI